MRHTILGICAAIGLLISCATPTAQVASTQENTSLAKGENTLSSEDVSLPAQTLQVNECGLFMWSKTDPSKFIFFNKAGEATALFLMDGRTTEITTVSASGDIFGQFFTDVDYLTETGRPISISYQAGENIANGARISSGFIQYRNDKNWLKTLPIVGVRFCQPLQPDTSAGPAQPRAQ